MKQKLNKRKVEAFNKAKLEVLSLNKKFNKATPEQKRVLIAQDVLLQLSLKKYKARSGTYFETKNDTNDKVLKADESLQDILLIPDVQCNVCAIGSAFASCIRIHNEFKIEGKYLEGYNGISNEMGDKPMRGVLQKYFSKEQLNLIEDAFEGWSMYGYDRLEKFYKKFNNSEDRLKGIMQNIIDNKGTFKI